MSNRKWFKIIFSLYLAFAFLTPAVVVHASANSEELLTDIGVPEELLETLSEEQKQWINDTLLKKNTEGMRYTEFSVERLLRDIPEDNVPDINMIGITYQENGTDYCLIFSCFRWKEPTRIKNHQYSAYMLNQTWEICVGEKKFCFSAGSGAEWKELDPLSAGALGYAFVVPENYGRKAACYEGILYMQMERKESSGTNKIVLTYTGSGDQASSDIKYILLVGAGLLFISAAIIIRRKYKKPDD